MKSKEREIRLLFLDIDGVLNSGDWFASEEFKVLDRCVPKTNYALTDTGRKGLLTHLDPTACSVLGQAADYLRVQVVLSSTWRVIHGHHLVQDLLRERQCSLDIIDITPTRLQSRHSGIPHKTCRGMEIEWWLLQNYSLEELEGARIVLLDDSSDMGRLLPRLVRTGWYKGLQEEHIEQIQQMLEKPLGPTLTTPNPLWHSSARQELYGGDV